MGVENTAVKKSSFASYFAPLVIILAIVISELLFFFVLGDKSNFEGADVEHGHPINYLGIVYKGGIIVPILMSFLLMVVIFSIERVITLAKASGKGSIDGFVLNIQHLLAKNSVDAAIAECDVQQGSIGNVVKAVLVKYKEVVQDSNFSKDQKIASLQKELEESTQLELPALERNLPVLATLGSVGTLVALLGTVLGMIKAFAAMSTAGAPDASALATGISEALINTAIGIGTSALAIIVYNYFTNQIDQISYRIDEAGLSIIQTFSSFNK